MSKKTKYHPAIEPFERYLSEGLLPKEQNQFERSLQCDEFESDALEGFSKYPIKVLSQDLHRFDVLKNHSGTVKMLLRAAFYVVVASFLFLCTYLLFDYLKPTPSLQTKNSQPKKSTYEKAEKETIKTFDVIQEPAYAAPIDSNITITLSTDSTGLSPKDLGVMMVAGNIGKSTLSARKQGVVPERRVYQHDMKPLEPITWEKKSSEQEKAQHQLIASTNVQAGDIADNPMIGTAQSFKGRIVNSIDRQAISGALVQLKGKSIEAHSKSDGSFSIAVPTDTYPLFVISHSGMVNKEMIFDRNTGIIVTLEPLAEDQPYPTSSSQVNAQPEPLGGMSLYRSYLEKNIRYPKEMAIPRRETVRVRFKVSLVGDPFDIVVDRSPGEAFTYEATRLVLEGPRWSPAIQNGRPVIGEASLRINFRP